MRGFPELDQDELIRFFTLTASDEAFVRSHRGSSNHLGVAVQLCTLPWLGFVPDDVASAPAHAVQRLASTSAFRRTPSPPTRPGTRPEPTISWRWPSCSAGDVEFKELDQFLAARALEHDSPTLLFRLACDYLRSARVVRPGPEWLSRRVATARESARVETYQRVEPLLDARNELRSELDSLLTWTPTLGQP
ncbi:MAG TPA: DUF4158 domain-containing protein, partial [Acidimicrobiales bacterium]|nr:DUF4158 domain-containing protein [Acidimicrobiales bacterium]